MLVCGLFIAGCAQVNNPWKDSSVAINQDMTTPSADAYSKDRAEFAAETRRTWSPSSVEFHNGSVTHWPLWFEDPFEDRGNTDVPMKCPDAERDLPDNVFAWNWVDYFDMAYGPARQVLNIVGWPVSAIVTPPGTLMESDGRISKGLLGWDHDAKRACPDREPPDVAMLNPPYSHPEQKQPPRPVGDQ
jgi:hypothetical protein